MSSPDVMTYRGYKARVEFDAADGVFFGRLMDIGDIVAFHADDTTGLEPAFHDAVDDHATTCDMVGKAPQQPFSGMLTLRVTPEVYAKATLAAHLSGKSVDQWGEDVLSAAARRTTTD